MGSVNYRKRTTVTVYALSGRGDGLAGKACGPGFKCPEPARSLWSSDVQMWSHVVWCSVLRWESEKGQQACVGIREQQRSGVKQGGKARANLKLPFDLHIYSLTPTGQSFFFFPAKILSLIDRNLFLLWTPTRTKTLSRDTLKPIYLSILMCVWLMPGKWILL